MTTHSPFADARVRMALIMAGAIALVAVAAPVAAPYDPTAFSGMPIAAPSFAHPFGTDALSRDVLSRVLYGARISILVAGLAVMLSITVGTGVGLAAGLGGNWMDILLMRFVDCALAVPRVFLVLMVIALWERIELPTLILMLGLTSWFGTSRLVRAEVLSARARDYVIAARGLGLSTWQVAVRHILPNITAPILVTATLSVGQIILVEAGLSFLGVGVPPPSPSLGNMIAEGRMLQVAPWIATFPGAVVVAIVFGFTAIGERLRKALDPRELAA